MYTFTTFMYKMAKCKQIERSDPVLDSNPEQCPERLLGFGHAKQFRICPARYPDPQHC
jgi:hypothetical protein